MTAPHRASGLALAITLILFLLLAGALSWLALAVLQQLRRPRRWPKPPRSWLRDFRAEAEERRRNGGRS